MTHEPLCAGDLAPDFTLASGSGAFVHLYSQLEHSSVVLFFYLKAFTPVCMAEVCGFRDHAAEFKQLGAAVFGIGSEGESATRRFADYHKLPYPLLIDPDNRVRAAYRVPKVMGVLPGRSTYVIGQDRIILKVTYTALGSAPHVSESLKVLRSERQ